MLFATPFNHEAKTHDSFGGFKFKPSLRSSERDSSLKKLEQTVPPTEQWAREHNCLRNRNAYSSDQL